MLDDTICALSTPPVNSTLAVIRSSGPESLRAAQSVFSSPLKIKPRQAVYGSIISGSKIVDDVILIYYKSPSSFTGEDMVEIFCHGNRRVVSKIMGLLLDCGLRMAEPGEFSKRAFLNGKIDLTEAEAINHLITARSDWEIEASINQMHGSLRREVDSLREKIIVFKADIESAIDFSGEDIEFVASEDAFKQIEGIGSDIEALLSRCKTGERISHGIDTAIVGRPNTGKSSILNLILNQERAIVSDIPGTTRDIIRESVQFGGIQINLIDTAGIGIPSDEIEKIGIERSHKNIESASIVLLVLDGTSGLLDQDMDIINRIPKQKTIFIVNKTDAAGEGMIKQIEDKLFGSRIVRFSAKTGFGLKDLEMAIGAMLDGEFVDYKNSFAADMRIVNILERAVSSAAEVKKLILSKEPDEIVAFELQSLIDGLGEITGQILPDEILNSIFSRFCIGK